MNDRTPSQTDLPAAAEWWTRLRDPQRGAGTEAQWLEWSTADARRLDAFERIDDLAVRLRGLDDEARRAFVREFAPRANARHTWIAAAAAVVAVVLGGACLAWPSLAARDVQTENFSTAVAVDRNIDLADGSHVALGGASRLQTRFGRDLREVTLSTGEAFFQVAHDTSRPFIVAAGAVSIRAVGTAFNVRRTGEHVTIAVTEGRVRIASSDDAAMAKTSGADALEAVAGQEVTYNPRASGLAVTAMSPALATSWRDHRLEFVNEPLDVVVANINRYSRRPLRIADAKLETLAFTGTVKPEAIDGWLKALPVILPVRVDEAGDQVTIERKPR
ncbi:MAG TPA: FecR domain-containing protein [Rudaea sp.]